MSIPPLLQRLEPRRFLDAGDLDATFGAGGHTTLSIGNGELIQQELDAVATGQVIVTAHTYDLPRVPSDDRDPDGFNIRLWRLAPDGSPDEDFGADGTIVLHVSPTVVVNRSFTQYPASTSTSIFGDGSFLVQVGNLLYKYNPHGRPDWSFGKHGRVIARAFNRENGVAAAVDLQDRIYVSGIDAEGRLLIARLAANGKPDLSFGSDGVMLFGDVAPKLSGSRPMAAERIADGSVMVSVLAQGTAETGEFFYPTYDQFTIKFTAAGIIDTSYADSGIRRTRDGTNELMTFSASRPLVSSDGWTFLNLLVNDTADTTRSTVIADSAGEEPVGTRSFETRAVLRDGGLFVTAGAFEDESFTPPAVVFRDSTFHPIAAARDAAAAALGSTWEPVELAAQTDGSILVLGETALPETPELAVFRLFRDDSPAAQVSARKLARERHASYRFTVQYRDDDGIDVATLGDDDITVALPDGTRRRARLVSTDARGASSKVVHATYLLTSPDGAWTAADNGKYVIRVQRRSVRDSAGNAAAQRAIGAFTVAIPDVTSAAVQRVPSARFDSARTELLTELA